MPGKHTAQHIATKRTTGRAAGSGAVPRHTTGGYDEYDYEYDDVEYPRARSSASQTQHTARPASQPQPIEKPRARYESEYDYDDYDDYDEEEPRRRPTGRAAAPTRSKPAKKRGVLSLLVRDVILAGIILCVFATFHHVIPRLSAKGQTADVISTITPPASTSIPAPTPGVDPAPSQETGADEQPVIQEPEVIDTRTEWQKKFESFFTDDIVQTENSYTSPNVSINIDTRVYTSEKGFNTTYYFADIYVGSIDNFQTYFANGKMTYYGYESPESAARSSNALISINGDYADNQTSGFLVRNGQLYYDDKSIFDICVLYYDGVMETYTPNEYEVQEVLDRAPYQIWKFGPSLLDASGNPRASFNTSDEIIWENPRSGVGYFEPGHYCFLMVDGRQDASRGLTMTEFANLFQSLGCKAAYNLDGGASAVMTFNGSIYSKPSNGGRDSGDILLIAETPAASDEK